MAFIVKGKLKVDCELYLEGMIYNGKEEHVLGLLKAKVLEEVSAEVAAKAVQGPVSKLELAAKETAAVVGLQAPSAVEGLSVEMAPKTKKK